MAETKPPNAREPVSPINTLAGYTLYKKNPSNAPTKAALIGSSPVPIATVVKNTAIANARKEIEEHYNSRNLIDRYKELYMENLQRKNWHNKKKYKKN